MTNYLSSGTLNLTNRLTFDKWGICHPVFMVAPSLACCMFDVAVLSTCIYQTFRIYEVQ